MTEFTTFEIEKGRRLRVDPPNYVNDAELNLNENQLKVLGKRYLRRDEFGNEMETPAGMFFRVARTVAMSEPELPVEQQDGSFGNVESLTKLFYDIMADFCFLPNSPTFTGAGTPLGQLAACFVLPIADDMGGQSDGIFSTLRVAALIQQTGGGNGFDFSQIRPAGDVVHTSAGKATGPIGVLQVYDAAFGEIAQGGTRRGANMAVLRVDHPDIKRFVHCKSQEGEIANFNISVGITDKFMSAVEQDGDFNLVNPRDGSVWETVRAKELFDQIVEGAHRNGEPGMLFLDRANADNPVPHMYTLAATNPCGEQWLGPYENCCLGSVNLAQHWYEDSGVPGVDWFKLEKTVKAATHFLDNVVTANKYVPAVPAIQEAAHKTRRIGLGIMGLADLMYRMGIRYGSEEAQEFSAQIMEFVRYHCMYYSVVLAQQKGPFQSIKDSIYDPDGVSEFWQTPPPYTYNHDWGRPEVDWTQIEAGIRKYGIRNAAQTTVAPTGTISTVSGCEGYGCEPVFALGYVRHFNDEGKDVELSYTSPLFERELRKARWGLDEKTTARILEEVARTGSCQHIDEVPDHIKNAFVVSSDITPTEHVAMQAAIQEFVDNSISKTCNFPAGTEPSDVARAYVGAWKARCKGLTVYVTGSRDEVVLETQETKNSKGAAFGLGPGEVVRDEESGMLFYEHENERVLIGHLPEKSIEAFKSLASQLKLERVSSDIAMGQPKKRERPYTLTGHSYRKSTPNGTAYITINDDDDGEPFEVFITVGKAGSSVAAVSESLGRLISLILRMPSPQSPTDRLKLVADDLIHIGGNRMSGFGPNRVKSLPDGIAQVMTDYLYEVEDDDAPDVSVNSSSMTVSGDLCPSCGEGSLIHAEGCEKCFLCSYSVC